MKTVGQNNVRKVRNKIASQRIKIPYLKINSNVTMNVWKTGKERVGGDGNGG